MSLERDIVLLSDVPLFEDLSQDHLRLLAFSAIRRDLDAGTVLFQRGEPAASGFVVATGQVELRAGDEGRGKVLATCRRGYLIGEVPLFIEGKRPATAIATDAATVLELTRDLVLRMMTEYPQVAMRIRASLGDRVAGTIEELRRVREALLRIDTR